MHLFTWLFDQSIWNYDLNQSHPLKVTRKEGAGFIELADQSPSPLLHQTNASCWLATLICKLSIILEINQQAALRCLHSTPSQSANLEDDSPGIYVSYIYSRTRPAQAWSLEKLKSILWATQNANVAKASLFARHWTAIVIRKPLTKF